MRRQLTDERLAPALVSASIRLPSQKAIARELKDVDLYAVYAARKH